MGFGGLVGWQQAPVRMPVAVCARTHPPVKLLSYRPSTRSVSLTLIARPETRMLSSMPLSLIAQLKINCPREEERGFIISSL